MSFQNLWDGVALAIGAVSRSELLLVAVSAMVVSWIGTIMVRRSVPMGGLLRTAGTLTLVGVLAMVVLQLSRMDPRIAMSLPEFGIPEQVVEGRETRITMSGDGHFWLRAELNGVPANFLVDTGATVTAISQGLADKAGLEPRRGGLPIAIGTANGMVEAKLSTIDELRFGNVSARGLDVVIAPTLGETNVAGMNLLSRLASWRVEGDTMILVPNHPQPTVELR